MSTTPPRPVRQAPSGIDLRDKLIPFAGRPRGITQWAGVSVLLRRDPDGIFLVSDAEGGHPLASFYAEHGGWWTIVRPNGTEVQVWKPGAGPEEITVRALAG